MPVEQQRADHPHGDLHVPYRHLAALPQDGLVVEPFQGQPEERPPGGPLKRHPPDRRSALAVAKPRFERVGGDGAGHDRSNDVLVLLRRQGGTGSSGGGRGGDWIGEGGRARATAAVFLGNEAVVVDVPGVVGGACDEGLDEIDAEEAEEVDEGGDEGEDGGDFGEVEDVQRSGGTDLVAPAVEEVVGEGKEEGEENAIGEV